MIKHLFIVSLLSAIVLSRSVHAQEPGPLIVHFAFDSYQLSATEKEGIDLFFREIARSGDTAIRKGKSDLVTRSGHRGASLRDTIVISGYTDSIGTSSYNDSLSLRRALAVKTYLVARGLAAADRIKPGGYGKRYPLTGNASNSERAENRRAEIFFRPALADTVASMSPVQRDSVVAGVPAAVAVKRDSVPAAVQRDSAVAPVTPAMSVPAVVPVTPAAPKRTIYDAVMDSSVAVGSTIPLRDVNFYPGRHIPLPVSNLILDELARAMKTNRRLRIHIEGHICCLPDGIDGADLGTGQPNLSVQRAKYVYDYLVQLGIAKRRMSYAGFGASGKLYPREENEVERAKNRRVEIRILAR